MSYRNERFNKGMRSLEAMTGEMKDVSKAKVFSDRGEGVERMVVALDYDTKSETTYDQKHALTRDEKLFEAEMRLVEADKRHLIRVLLLIVENGNDFHRSIEALISTSKSRNAARKKYFQHRDALLGFFKK